MENKNINQQWMPRPNQQSFQFGNVTQGQANYQPGQLMSEPTDQMMRAHQNQLNGQPSGNQQMMMNQAQMQQAMESRQQANQTQNKQTGAFPQNGMSPHQMFIQTALRQGYSPDMVMQFLSNQLNLSPTKK